MQPTESLMHLFFQSFSGRDTDILSCWVRREYVLEFKHFEGRRLQPSRHENASFSASNEH